MYGILAACIAVMAMFLGLFALSVEPNSKNLQDKLTMETAQAPLAQVSAKERPYVASATALCRLATGHECVNKQGAY